VKTGRSGAAAKAGHNLVIHVQSWRATIVIAPEPADSSAQLEADAASLRVREGRGGMQALGEDDKASIVQSIDEDVLKRQVITFRSTSARVNADGRSLQVQGDLTLVGKTRPVAFTLEVDDDDRLVGGCVITQSEWGIKPYSTLFGALKVVDEVEVAIDAALPDRDDRSQSV
jgi:polyisoprenoid-binding protein YceI